MKDAAAPADTTEPSIDAPSSINAEKDPAPLPSQLASKEAEAPSTDPAPAKETNAVSSTAVEVAAASTSKELGEGEGEAAGELSVADELEMAVAHELEDIAEVPELEEKGAGGVSSQEKEVVGKEKEQEVPKIVNGTDDSLSTDAAALSTSTNSSGNPPRRSPPVPAGGLVMPPGLQSMSQKDVRKRFNGHKIMCVLALNIELIK